MNRIMRHNSSRYDKYAVLFVQSVEGTVCLQEGQLCDLVISLIPRISGMNQIVQAVLIAVNFCPFYQLTF